MAGSGRGMGQPQPQGSAAAASGRRGSTTVEEIRRIDMNREQRRRAAEEVRRSRQEEAALLGAQCGGAVPDVDFHRMIRDFRQQCAQGSPLEPLSPDDPDSILVCVRKRPIQQHEAINREIDAVTACNPYAIVHERKFKVDGITKCLESHQFEFDAVYDEDATTEDLYRTVAHPLVPWVIEKGGRATLFAYGQTGSGKTHTMTGIQRQLSEQIFEHVRSANETLEVSVSFFEIYGGRPYDLLNGRQRLETLEDARNEVQIAGLTERAAGSPEALLQYIDLGNSLRTTHATAINRDSSRSHAVCSVFLRMASSGGNIHGKVTLVDLAGSERAADSKSTIRQRRVEGAQINKSLLALKECIRAMGDPREAHVPFRASKLTLVLRDAFVSRCPSKTVMIACISPGTNSADHSVNTLRYSDRLKDHSRAMRGPVEARTPLEDGGGDGERIFRTRSGAKSPEPRAPSRGKRSPSPAPGGQRYAPWRPQPASASAPELPKDGHGQAGGARAVPVEADDDEESSLATNGPEAEADAEASAPIAAWGEAGDCHAVPDAPRAIPSGTRQVLPRRGRQPTLRPREGGAPTRPDALGSRGHHGEAAAARERVAAAGALPMPSPEGASASSGQVRSPRLRGRSVEPTPGVRPADQYQQDNRYLHNTLTSEVFERERQDGAGLGVVDVGVEDLKDLEHMEALDEVRQWEDRIVSQHMVALQEDARLLTAESELLSQVQQGSSYDIDWYVVEVDKVVRRKMEVYASFLEELEVFKAQLRHEESLSRSCQRNRVGSISSVHGLTGVAGAEGVVRDGGLAEGIPQRTPRTPRAVGSGAMQVGAGKD
mmetsp:Transcript_18912/g.41276  ORF Transcript_18912/g.41276 Transcript_18912/m.41276 type:complete len:830 (-) Transcript_18912:80-2569(-)